MYKSKFYKVGLLLFSILFIVILTSNVYAEDELELEMSSTKSDDISSTIVTNISESTIGKFQYNKIPSIVDDLIEIRSAYSLQSIGASYSDSYYSIADEKKVNVRNQKNTSSCWIIPAITSMEVNMQLSNQTNDMQQLSTRHCEYSTARNSFVDGVNELGYNRRAGEGGRPTFAYSYLINGTGAVLESDMPFEDNSNNITLNEIKKDIYQIATGYQVLPCINKTYDSAGNVTYYDEIGRQLSNTEVKALRNIIKSHIINYGAISTTTYSDSSRPFYFNNPSNVRASVAYYADDENIVANHGVTIIGWDDSYSRDNFNSSHKPQKDGAYIAVDSYGEDVHNHGMFYISYDDVLVEYNMIGITGTSAKDYDTIYQNDFFGATHTIGNKNYDVGYLASVFERDKNKNETLEYVGISSSNYAKYEIYVNPRGTSLNQNMLTKVGETAELMPGYTRVAINPIKLEGSHFAIVLKQTSEQGEGFFFTVEAPIPNTPYDVVKGTDEGSYISYDGRNWKDIKGVKITGHDLTEADTCIKGYIIEHNDENPDNPADTTTDTTDTTTTSDTTETSTDTTNPIEVVEDDYELSIKTTKYMIKDGYLSKIEPNTSIETMLQNINNNAKSISIIDSSGKSIIDLNMIVKTGMTITFNDEVSYKLVVRGDINGDGKVTLTDISKLVFHYNGDKEYQLEGPPLVACDMNYDGKISLTDVSQLVFYYSSI